MSIPSAVRVYLGLGSNMNAPEAQLAKGVAALQLLPATRVVRTSPVYESKAWGKTDQPSFLNMVAEIETGLDPQALLRDLKAIEAEQGRTAGERWGPRPLDIDILIYDDVQISTAQLTIPHKRMWERAFVLVPLADLRPDLVAPDGRAIGEVLQSEAIAGQGVWLHESARKQAK